jgi:acetyl esterase/lipase
MVIRSKAWKATLLSAAVMVASLLVAIAQTAPAAKPTTNVQETTTNVVVEKDITYGRGGTEDLKLDLARPEHADGLLPGIVYIHGGGWSGGNRIAYRNEIQEAAKRGYVAVTIEYRLTQPDKSGKAKYPFPAQIEDSKCAVRWLRANAEKYHVDPNRIGATGGSAGGHLSLLVGVTGSSKKFDGTGGNPDASSQVQAVVNYFGPTDLARMYGYEKRVDRLLDTLVGGKPQERPDEYKSASPISYVSKDVCPILSIHGTADKLVPVDQAVQFDAAMKKAGAASELIILEGEEHGFRGPADRKAREATFAFFDKYLKPAK